MTTVPCLVGTFWHRYLKIVGHETLYANYEILEAYVCTDLNGKLQSLWLYVQRSMRQVARLGLYQVEG